MLCNIKIKNAIAIRKKESVIYWSARTIVNVLTLQEIIWKNGRIVHTKKK